MIRRMRNLAVVTVLAVTLGLASRAVANDIALFQTVFSTDFTVAGVGGLRNVGSGTIALSGVSGTVTQAFLYWHGPTNSADPNANANILVNGTPVTGTNIGFSDNNCWGFNNSQAYRADVTALVSATGNGNYALTGLGSGSPVNSNGASLIVFFDDGDSSNNRDAVVFDGNDSNISNPFDAPGWNVTLGGINYTAGSAALQMHVADGQTYLDDALILNGNVLVPAGPVFQGDSVPSANNGPGNNGSLWDIRTEDVTSFLVPGPNTLTLTTGVNSDCLALVAAIVDLPAGAAPNQPPQAVCEPGPINLEADDNCCVTVTVDDIDAGSNDPDDEVDTLCITEVDGNPVGCLQSVQICGDGSHTVQLTITDVAGESDSCTTEVIIVDGPNTPPDITCPDDVVIECGTPIELGACCLDDSCQDITEGECALLMGVFNPGISCDSGICDSPECEAASCGNFVPCEGNGACVCVSLSSGSGGVCVVGSTSCAPLTLCPNGVSDCAAGEVCAVDTCCGDPVCVPQSAFCPDAAQMPEPPPEGTLTIWGEQPPPGANGQDQDGLATATDNCDADPDVSFEDTVVEGCGDTQTTTRVWTAVDDAGNSSSCTQTISIVDTTDPEITCPGNLTLECDGAGNAAAVNAWLADVSASDTCGGVSITNDFTGLSDDCGATGSATVIWTATDDCDRTATCSATVTIVDTVDPTITCPDNLTLECDGAGNTAAVNAWLADVSASDTCGDVTITNDFAGLSDDCGATGSATVVWTATDDCNRTATCTATVTVEDTTDPEITCPDSLTVECDGEGNTADLNAWLAGTTASDECGEVTITNDFAGLSDGCGATGTATVTWTATDDCDRTAMCSATFTIVDTIDKVITCPEDLTVECDGAGNTAELDAWLADVSAADACGDVTIVNDFAGLSDGCGATGTATVTWTATDDCDNTSACSATFAIVDTTNPVVDTCPAPTTVECDGEGNTAELNAWLDSFAGSDTCGDVTLTDNFAGLSDDCGETGTATVVFTVTDDCGLLTSCTSTFTIEDTIDPSIDNCPAETTVECDGEGNAAELEAWLDSFEASDICSDVTLTNDFKGLSDDCGETGSATVEFLATDDCGLDTSCESTFVIEDTISPEITCPADVTIISGDSTDPDATGSATATDVCDQADPTIVSEDEVTIPDCLADPIHFTIAREWTATDDCGNSSSCVQTITVMRQEVSLIIKQGACPAPVNPNSNGVVPMLLTGDTDFDVNNVLLGTLRVTRCDCTGGDVAPNDGPPGPKIMILDLNHPFDGDVDCVNGPCACNANQDSDGIDDIWMKFRTDEMVSALPLASGEGTVILSVTGELDASAYPAGPINVGFIASDCILIVPPGADPINATVGSNVADTYVEVLPLDLNVDSDGFTNFGRAYFPDTLVTVTAPPSSAGRRFLRWKVDGVLQAIGLRTLEVEVTSDVNLEAIYRRPSRIEPDDPPTESDGDME